MSMNKNHEMCYCLLTTKCGQYIMCLWPHIESGRRAIMKNKKIGSTLIDLRIKAGVSQRELGAAIGVSRTAIANYEQGIRIPRDEIKVKLANYYGKSVEEIFFNH